jgi:hypothetical protein
MQNRNNQNYGKTDPDFIDQDTIVNTDTNYSPDEDQYQYQEEFIPDINHETNDFNRNENIPNEERIINEDGLITNDEDKDNHDPAELDYENDLEKDSDLDDEDSDEMDDFEAEHFPETHPRE